MACKPAKFHLLHPASIPREIIKKLKEETCKSVQGPKPNCYLESRKKEYCLTNKFYLTMLCKRIKRICIVYCALQKSSMQSLKLSYLRSNHLNIEKRWNDIIQWVRINANVLGGR